MAKLLCVLVLVVPCLQALPQKAPAAPTIPDGPRGGGAVFAKCGGLLGIGAKDLCYEVTLKNILVQNGKDGTTEDITAKICADDKKTCCETPVLKSARGGDWSAFKLDTWEKKHFGLCIDKKFKLKTGMELALSKKGSQNLEVDSLFIEAETINSEGKKEIERFECGSYKIGGTSANSSTQNRVCKTSPYVYERVKLINVTMGNDGTNDNVKAEFCSDVNEVCCRTKLSGTLSDDWSKNDVEIWKESDLGDCKVMQYKISGTGGPRLTLVKEGKDDLIVNKILVETESIYGDKYTYDCGDYKLASGGVPCVAGVNCIQTKGCKKILANGSPYVVPATTTTRAPTTTTTRRSERIATSTPRSGFSTTTTRPPFRSGSG